MFWPYGTAAPPALQCAPIRRPGPKENDVLDRREFLSSAAVAALAASPVARAAAPKRTFTEQAYSKAIVIDALGGPGGSTRTRRIDASLGERRSRM